MLSSYIEFHRTGITEICAKQRGQLNIGLLGIVRLKAGDVIRLFMRDHPLMRTSVSPCQRHCFPAEIISPCVWLFLTSLALPLAARVP
jgi:hypothetical protein